MMKKIISALILFLIVFLYTPSSISAACRIKPLLGCPGTHPNLCGDGNNCCTTAGECSVYPAPPTPTPTVVVVATGTCNCAGMSCGNVVSSNCGGTAPVCSGNLGFCGCTCGAAVTNGAERCGDGIDTAIGCIPVLAPDNGVSFMAWILKWAVGIGGGIAFMLIIYGGFMYMTSQGNPERVKAGQELITSAVSGLLLLVLSIFLLNFIGVDILHLNLFGFGQ